MIVDSGCTGYMPKDSELCSDLDKTRGGVVGNTNSSWSRIEGHGTAEFWVDDSTGRARHLKLKDASYAPSYSHNLVSVSKLNTNGAVATFNKDEAWIKAPDGKKLALMRENHLFILKGSNTPSTDVANKAVFIERLHQRLGHKNTKDVGNLEQLVDEMVIDEGHSTSDVCAPCATQKSKRATMKNSWGTMVKDKLMIVHTDTLGPLNAKSSDGYHYAVGLNHSYSRYAEVYFMQSKVETLAKFQQFVADVGKPATLVTDGALEYNSIAFNKYCREQAIRHEFSTPYMPKDNGKIERVWGTVVGMTKCMMDQAKMPPMFWTFAL